MKKTFLTLTTITYLSANWSFASTSEFEVCRDALKPTAQQILDKVTDQLQSKADAEKVIKSTVREMVMAGEIERATARTHALSAVDCLKKLES